MKKFFYFLSLIILIGIDQIVKVATVLYLKDSPAVVVINKVFEFTYVENRGTAFGMFQGGVPFFAIMTIVLLIIVLYFFIKLPNNKKMEPLRILCLLIVAGGIGNLIDRIFRGFVVDTFYFKLIDFPVFNVADCYVTVSLFVFIFLFLFYYKDDDFVGVFPDKKASVKSKTAVSENNSETGKDENIGE